VGRYYGNWLLRFTALVAVAVTIPANTATAAEKRPPNVVFILIDDLGWKDVGCYGSTFYETPNINRLARQGMRFTDAYAACCVCSPTRASILTGKYPARLHLTDYIPGFTPKTAKLVVPPWTQYLPLEEITLARALKPEGYCSACVGKWHLAPFPKTADGKVEKEITPEKHGFDVNAGGCYLGQPPDYFFPYRRKIADGREFQLLNLAGGKAGEYLTDRLTDEAEAFIERNREKPFFLYLAHYAVHTAIGARLQGKPALVEKYKSKAPTDGQKNPNYAAMIESMDESVRRIVRKLEALKLTDNTIVIFTSDNGGLGWTTSHAPLRGAKAMAYDGGVRVPLIVSWPGMVKPGSTCSEPVISVDFFPTILEIAGQKEKLDPKVDGESLVPLLSGKGSLHRKAIYWHYPHYSDVTTPYAAIRRGDFKLIEFFENGRQELYNLKEDIGEKNNLVGKMPEKVKELDEMLKEWQKSVGAQMPAP
jgi:arylsulfatase A